ncbi:MAG: hypothetical protein GKS02_03100 [Alphaproteobacteria bacterium]|nr:hypothetical protein [Alphaproteobacteria bacterium]
MTEREIIELIGLLVVFSGLAGYYGSAFFAKTLLRALVFNLFLGVALYTVMGTLKSASPLGFDVLAACNGLHQIGTIKFDGSAYTSSMFKGLAVCFAVNQIVAIVLTVVFYLDRWIYDRV